MANFLYNGVKLTDIHEVWTDELKTQYPLVTLLRTDYKTNNMVIYTLHFDRFTANIDIGGYEEDNDVHFYTQYIGGSWSELKQTSDVDVYAFDTDLWAYTAVWANYDILCTDGSVHLAASEPAPVPPKITESKGDGYALYNGHKLPNIDTVWMDKAALPYAILSAVDLSEAGFSGKLYQLRLHLNVGVAKENSNSIGMEYGGSGSMVSYLAIDNEESANYLHEVFGLSVNVGEWVHYATNSGTSVTSDLQAVFWSSYDVCTTSGSTYLEATDPIPLDGMNVIEWDGVTTDLVSLYDVFYRVSDYFVPTDALAVYTSMDETLVSNVLLKENYGWSLEHIGEAGDVFPVVGLTEDGAAQMGSEASGVFLSVDCALLAYTPTALEPPTTPTYDPVSMFLGWLAGKRVAGQRGTR